jgi:HAD superfamily hydrolase (TIGR01509 family)
VLLDSEPVYFQIEREMLAEHGATLEWSEYIETLGHTVWAAWQRLVSVHGLNEDPRALGLEESRRALERFRQGVTSSPGILEFIRRLRAAGVAIGIGSSSDRPLIDAKLAGVGVTDVDAIASGDEVERGKPDPALFLLTAERLGIAPEHCVVVEDSRFGLEAARRAGMQPVFFDRYATAEPDASLYVARWSDFGRLDVTDVPFRQ